VSNAWTPAQTTFADGETVITLGSQSSSVVATFLWESREQGQPLLVLIWEDPDTGEMDWQNSNGMNIDITGINVKPIPITEESNNALYMVIGVAVIAVAVVAILVMRSRGEDDYYYEDDDTEYAEDDWEYEDDEGNDE